MALNRRTRQQEVDLVVVVTCHVVSKKSLEKEKHMKRRINPPTPHP
jgi:hypothetical protein